MPTNYGSHDFRNGRTARNLILYSNNARIFTSNYFLHSFIYYSHLESVKLNIKGLQEEQIPPLGKTFLRGIHFLIPIFILVYLLLIERWTAASAVFYSIYL